MKRKIKQRKNAIGRLTEAHVIDSHSCTGENEQESHQTRVIALSPSKVSIDEMRAIWNDDEVAYSDAELFRIRDWFYAVTEVMLQTIEVDEEYQTTQTHEIKEPKQRKTKTIPFPNQGSQSDTNETTKESHPLHPRIYRRAG